MCVGMEWWWHFLSFDRTILILKVKSTYKLEKIMVSDLLQCIVDALSQCLFKKAYSLSDKLNML